MGKSIMTPREMHDIYVFNCTRREALLAAAMAQENPEDKMKFVVDYFLDKLDPSVVAEIDGVSEKKIMPFKYDYSFLKDYGGAGARMPETRMWGEYNYGFSLPQADNDIRGSEKIKIFPTVYALKMGTCISFASEIQRFAHDFGIESELVQKMEYCYDYFDGVSVENKPIQSDRIIKMQHFYNVVTIDGKKYKIDIAGYLTAKDLNKNHPEINIKPEDFYFSDKIEKNPLAIAVETYGQDFVNLTSQNQPQ